MKIKLLLIFTCTIFNGVALCSETSEGTRYVAPRPIHPKAFLGSWKAHKTYNATQQSALTYAEWLDSAAGKEYMSRDLTKTPDNLTPSPEASLKHLARQQAQQNSTAATTSTPASDTTAQKTQQ